MTQTTAAQTITPNGQATLNPPSAGMAGVSALVLDNLSTYLLTVSVGGSTFYQAPLVEARYDLSSSNGNVSVTAHALPGDSSTSGTVAPTWYLQGEADPTAAYPIALSGPAEVAAATAAALLQTGVPNVLVTTTIFDQLIPRNTTWPAIDVSGYASLEITVSTQNSPYQNEMAYYYSNDGSTELQGDYLANLWQMVPVRAKYLQLANSSTSTDVQVQIVGTNRVMPALTDWSGSFSNSPARFAFGLSTLVAGTLYTVPGTNQAGQFQLPTGRCYLAMSLSTGTVARGILYLQYTAPDGTNQLMPLMDTGEAHLDNPSGALLDYKEVILPVNTNWSLVFQCRVAGSTAVTVFLVRDSR